VLILGHRIRLPEGYALFAHRKPQAEGKIREDVYLFGSKHVNKVGLTSRDDFEGLIEADR
jgi:hypothetical protein